jgi:MFS family permease
MGWLASFAVMLRPPHRDARGVFAVAALRAFAFGFLAVALGLYLRERGFSALQVGAVLTATLVGEAAITLLGGLFADRMGRRRFLALMALASAIGGVLFALAGHFALMMALAFLGTVSSRGKDRGPMTAVEQAILPQTCAPSERTRLFAGYNLVGTLAGAAGALFVSGAGLAFHALDLDALRGYQSLFFLYAALSAVAGALYLRLTAQVEAPEVERAAQRRLIPHIKSWKIIGGLSGLFAVDAFGGGLIIQSFVAYWLNARFGLGLETLGVAFFASGVLTSFSFPVAAWLAGRIGLINTMFFTHLPSNLLLIAVAFAPAAWLALALYLMREALSQMDVPTRQSYIVSVVGPDERTAAVSVTTLARNAAQAGTPTLAGYLVLALPAGAPFVVGGAVKAVYDVALWVAFRTVKPPEERQGSGAGQSAVQTPSVAQAPAARKLE